VRETRRVKIAPRLFVRKVDKNTEWQSKRVGSRMFVKNAASRSVEIIEPPLERSESKKMRV
jgi:hypothetical protein